MVALYDGVAFPNVKTVGKNTKPLKSYFEKPIFAFLFFETQFIFIHIFIFQVVYKNLTNKFKNKYYLLFIYEYSLGKNLTLKIKTFLEINEKRNL